MVNFKERRWYQRIMNSAMLYIVLLIMLIMILYPLAMVFLQSLFPDILGGSLKGFLSPFIQVFKSEGLLQVVVNTILWGIAVTIGCVIVGVPCGFILAKTDMPGKSVIRVIYAIPYMSPPYVGALAWILFIQEKGFLEEMLSGHLPAFVQELFFSFWGLTFIMVLFLYPFTALGVEAGLRALPSNFENSARVLGANRKALLRRIVVPLLMPVILNTGLLVFLQTVSNFGVPATLGSRARYPIITAEIYNLISSWPINFPVSTALSCILVAMALTIMYFSERVLKKRDYGVISGRGIYQVYSLNRRQRLLAAGFIFILFICSVAIPFGTMVLASLVKLWGGGFFNLSNYTLQNYYEVFGLHSPGLQALGVSFSLGLIAPTIILLGAAFISYVLAHYKGGLAFALNFIGFLPRSLPKVVVVVGLILAWNAPWMGIRIYNTYFMLLLAYIVLYLPDALRYGDSGMRNITKNLENSALVMGASKWRVFTKIIFPLLRPYLIASWILSFIISVRELVASILLLPPGLETTATYIFSQFEQGGLSEAMCMATVTITLTVVALLLFNLKYGGGPVQSRT
ncbi:MAG: iron ABC transporter permease [Desulfobacterales bacterium]|nr:iron ABC transporter permease [Desulfobacterales bacterium]MDX2513002.1 iron ABC transporter permease [Desulfobacterales bacterium]